MENISGLILHQKGAVYFDCERTNSALCRTFRFTAPPEGDITKSCPPRGLHQMQMSCSVVRTGVIVKVDSAKKVDPSSILVDPLLARVTRDVEVVIVI